jgi:MFS family permease
VIIFGVGLMLLSRTDTLVQFYAAFVVVALGASRFSNFLVSISLIQWFEKRRTKALSMLQFDGAVVGMFVFIVAESIQISGWRWTLVASGDFAMLIGYPLARVIRSRPEDHGITIDGASPALKAAAAGVTAPRPAVPPAFSRRQALRTSAFWLLSLGHALALLVVIAINVHVITHIKQELAIPSRRPRCFFRWSPPARSAG